MFPYALLFGMYNGKITLEYGVVVIFLFSTLSMCNRQNCDNEVYSMIYAKYISLSLLYSSISIASSAVL